MDTNIEILKHIPLFRHCSENEISELNKIATLTRVKKGQMLDLKKSNTLNVVVNGLFEIDSPGRTDPVYLGPGSFFGAVPFSNSRHGRASRAIMDSILFIFEETEIYRFFLVYYKCLRGYIRTIGRLGFDISTVGKKYFGENSCVVSVYSPFKDSGKSLFSSLFGLSVSSRGKTIILDVSYSGESVFNYFEKKITSPISQKIETETSVETMIHERIEPVSENLDLINISFGSKVKVDPEILSPILFVLSKEYKYIILDLSDYDSDLRNAALGLSDKVFTLIKKTKNLSNTYEVLDSNLKDCQRLYYIINEFYSGGIGEFEGGLILDKLDLDIQSSRYLSLCKYAESPVIEKYIDLLTTKKKALVLESGLMDAVFMSGFLSALEESGEKFDIFYSSAFSYFLIALFHLSRDEKDFKKRIKGFFSEEKINSFLDVTFPDKFIFKKNSISKYAADIAGNSRIEMFKNIPAALLCGENNNRRVFSTGYVRNILEASFCLEPLFESASIAENKYHSGYPFQKVCVEDLFRCDLDEIVHVSFKNSEKIKFKKGRLLEFYTRYIDFVSGMESGDSGNLSDRKVVLEFSETRLNSDKIFDVSKEAAAGILK